jgi:hypothetical protein
MAVTKSFTGNHRGPHHRELEMQNEFPELCYGQRRTLNQVSKTPILCKYTSQAASGVAQY